ncbi:hypothetical protein DJ84_21615, partial [Halorubrum ezzemoulense]
MTFGDLFERAAALGGDLDEADVRRALDAVRSTADGNGGDSGGDGDSGGEGNEVTDPLDPSPARVVAGADALAADLLLGGDAR